MSDRSIPIARFSTVVLLSVYLAYCQTPPSNIPKGVIEGVVLNEKSLPVRGAQVSVNQPGVPMLSAVRYVETDNSGHFKMDRLAWGRYDVFAQKLSAGYPDTSYAFYSNNVVTKALISSSSPEANVTVRVGPPCGVLQLDLVTDMATGAHLNYAVTLRRAANPRLYFVVGFSREPILIPSNTDILVEISATGYEPWPTRSERGRGKVRVSPNATYHLSAQLRKAP